jgi:hypothetical protein
MYIHYSISIHAQSLYTYYSRFIPEGVEKASQMFQRDAYVLPKRLNCENIADVTGKSSGVSAVGPKVAFYDIPGGKLLVLL